MLILEDSREYAQLKLSSPIVTTSSDYQVGIFDLSPASSMNTSLSSLRCTTLLGACRLPVASTSHSVASCQVRLQSTTASSSTSGSLPMTWPDYLSLRSRRRMLSTVCTIPATVGGLLAGGAYFGNKEMTLGGEDLIMGMEPMWVYAGAT